MSTSNIVNIGAVAIIIALAAGIFALAFNGTISGAEALAFLGPLAAAAIGVIAHAAGVQAGATAASPNPPPQA